jgi:hypothetical protein
VNAGHRKRDFFCALPSGPDTASGSFRRASDLRGTARPQPIGKQLWPPGQGSDIQGRVAAIGRWYPKGSAKPRSPLGPVAKGIEQRFPKQRVWRSKSLKSLKILDGVAPAWHWWMRDPGMTRTCDPWFRKPMLYPAELRGQRGILLSMVLRFCLDGGAGLKNRGVPMSPRCPQYPDSRRIWPIFRPVRCVPNAPLRTARKTATFVGVRPSQTRRPTQNRRKVETVTSGILREMTLRSA